MPIETEYLAPRNGAVCASLYLLWDERFGFLKDIKHLPVVMGAWRYKGFGRGTLSFCNSFEPRIIALELKSRVTERAAKALGICRILAPVYGYLFESTGVAAGQWARSLFEGSIVEGPEFLGESYPYDV